MAYRNKTYVAFDADTDMKYYRLMQAWKQNDNTDFDFYDAHDINNLMPTSTEETIKYKLQERLRNTKIFVLLIGEKTKNLHKFVRWEIEQAIKRGLPIIAVNLNGKRKKDDNRCPAILRDELAIHVSFNSKIIQYSLENWEYSHNKHRNNNETGAYYYIDSVYTDFGL